MGLFGSYEDKLRKKANDQIKKSGGAKVVNVTCSKCGKRHRVQTIGSGNTYTCSCGKTLYL